MSTALLWLERAQAKVRFGLKGAKAADRIRQAGLQVPDRANSWAPLRADPAADDAVVTDVIARLGSSEFFLEEAGVAPGIRALQSGLLPLDGAYPVLREDFALVLGGREACAALAEVCNIDFAAPEFTPGPTQRPVVMTLITGVSVLVLPQAPTLYRIWCDPSFGSYLWDTLAEIARRRT